jgi:hypothetical protein
VTESATHDVEAPPAGEELHLPGPSVVPLLNAVGITLALVGLTVGIAVSIIGIVLFLVTLVRWIRDTRADVDALPLEH